MKRYLVLALMSVPAAVFAGEVTITPSFDVAANSDLVNLRGAADASDPLRSNALSMIVKSGQVTLQPVSFRMPGAMPSGKGQVSSAISATTDGWVAGSNLGMSIEYVGGAEEEVIAYAKPPIDAGVDFNTVGIHEYCCSTTTCTHDSGTWNYATDQHDEFAGVPSVYFTCGAGETKFWRAYRSFEYGVVNERTDVIQIP